MSGRRQLGGAFAADRSAQTVRGALKAAFWTGAGVATRRLAKVGQTAAPPARPTAPPPPKGLVRRAWLEAFAKDRDDVGVGLYPAMDNGRLGPMAALRGLIDLVADARAVEARRARNGGVEARDETPSGAYPAYYRQNFHFQSGGWFTEESARRYEGQVEALFSGSAAAMRRRALSLLARAWRRRDQRGLAILDLACGSGPLLRDLARTFPRARLAGLDLSAAYLEQARLSSGLSGLVQARAEALPFANGSLDAVTCVYLFHELPATVRPLVAAEIARVLKPGGLFAFADSVQLADEPRLARLLEVFPAYFHEPYFADYAAADLEALFGDAGLVLKDQDGAFLTKAMLFERVNSPAAAR